MYPSLAWLAAAAAAALLYRGLGVAWGGYLSVLSRLGLLTAVDLFAAGVSPSTMLGLALVSLCGREDLALGAVFATSAISTSSAPSGCSQRPPPPSPPGMYLRLLFGGSVTASVVNRTRGARAGVRAVWRGESASAAMLAIVLSRMRVMRRGGVS